MTNISKWQQCMALDLTSVQLLSRRQGLGGKSHLVTLIMRERNVKFMHLAISMDMYGVNGTCFGSRMSIG